MKCIRAEGASPLVELQKLLFLQRGAEIHPEESERERETQTKETKRKRGNAVETEKGNGENREQEEGWVERGGGGGNKRLLKEKGSKKQRRRLCPCQYYTDRRKEKIGKSQSLRPEL